MVTIVSEYTGDLHTVCTHGPSNATIETDAPVDNEGRGEAFSPTDLLGTAMGSCMLTIMGIVARRDGIALEGAKVTVQKQMSQDLPRRIVRLDVVFELPAGIDPGDRAKLQAAAEGCPVQASLRADLEVSTEYRWS